MTEASLYSEFWTWFQANEANFPSTSEFDAAYGGELSARLTAIKSGLVYEVGILDNTENELIISGDGVKDLIPLVQEMVDSAPLIDGWKIIAFRPRMDDYASFVLSFGERNFDPKSLWCWSRIRLRLDGMGQKETGVYQDWLECTKQDNKPEFDEYTRTVATRFF